MREAAPPYDRALLLSPHREPYACFKSFIFAEQISGLLGSALPADAEAARKQLEDDARATLPSLPHASQFHMDGSSGSGSGSGAASGEESATSEQAKAREEELAEDCRARAAEFEATVAVAQDALREGREDAKAKWASYRAGGLSPDEERWTGTSAGAAGEDGDGVHQSSSSAMSV